MGDKASQNLLMPARRILQSALCALLAACLLPCALPAQQAQAENSYFTTEAYSKDLWTNHADTSWYTGNVDASSYVISTASQLAGLAKLVTMDHVSFRGKTVYLGADIDLKGHQWFPIGCNEDNYWQDSPFEGVFDGQGHVVSNLYINNSWHHQAFFGKVSDAVLKNFSVKGSVTTGWGAAGVTAEACRSTLSGIDNYCDVTTLYKSGDQGYSSMAGGIVAYVVDTYVTENGAQASVLSNLRNYGKIESAGITEQGGGVGGIAGSLTMADDSLSITVSQCENNGTVHALSSNGTDIYAKGAGGIVGSTATYGNYQISDCANNGDVTSDNLASTGGIVGSMSGIDSSVSYCYNTGTVNGASPESVSAVGGIVGRSVAAHTGSTLITVRSSYNTGKVIGRGANVSAILGATSGYGEDWDSNDGGTTVINDSNYYVEDSVQRSAQSSTLFQQGTVDAAQPVSSDRINSQEVVDTLNSTDEGMDHFTKGSVSPKLELKGSSDKGTDKESKKGDGTDENTIVAQGDAQQKETHLYSVSEDNAGVVDADIPVDVIALVLMASVLVLAAAGVAMQLGYYKSQRRKLKAVPRA